MSQGLEYFGLFVMVSLIWGGLTFLVIWRSRWSKNARGVKQ